MNAQTLRRPTRFRLGRRRGYGMAEVAVALLLLMVAMNLMVRILGVVGTERRASDRRLWAVETASNVLERASSEPFDAVTAKAVRAIADEADVAKVLPGAAWDVAVEADKEATVVAKKIALRLRWKERSGEWTSPVRLSTWVYRGKGRS